MPAAAGWIFVLQPAFRAAGPVGFFDGQLALRSRLFRVQPPYELMDCDVGAEAAVVHAIKGVPAGLHLQFWFCACCACESNALRYGCKPVQDMHRGAVCGLDLGKFVACVLAAGRLRPSAALPHLS
jgi:hypothetical protein